MTKTGPSHTPTVGGVFGLGSAAVVHVELPAGSIVVVVTDKKVGRGAGLWIPDSATGREQVSHWVGQLVQSFKNSDQLEFKVIAPKASHDWIEKLGKDQGWKHTRTVAHEGEIELVFYPESSRVRLAKGDMPSGSVSTPQVRDTIRVLIVDDSKTIRDLLTRVLSADPEIEVLGALERPTDVAAFIAQHKPDVITLDIHMPEMNGVELLRKIIPQFRVPAVMISSISMEEGPLVLEALEEGAVDYIQKPSLSQLPVMGPMILEKVKNASRAHVVPKSEKRVSKQDFNVNLELDFDPRTVIAIGSSTGGTEALRDVLTRLPKAIPPIVIVQHIPAVFSKAFALRMNDLCPFEVKEAEHGDDVKAGRVIIAAGGTQMALKKGSNKDGAWKIEVTDGAPVNRHKPSVDVLFDSVADLVGKHAVGVILTGMGADGAKGLLKIKNAGAPTIAQDEATCVVFGMPREAIKLGAADKILPLDEIAQGIVKVLTRRKAA